MSLALCSAKDAPQTVHLNILSDNREKVNLKKLSKLIFSESALESMGKTNYIFSRKKQRVP